MMTGSLPAPTGDLLDYRHGSVGLVPADPRPTAHAMATGSSRGLPRGVKGSPDLPSLAWMMARGWSHPDLLADLRSQVGDNAVRGDGADREPDHPAESGPDHTFSR
jgi:hypothetical protein